MNCEPQVTTRTDLLVIGYGNTLRGDDGLGPRVAEAVERQELIVEGVVSIVDGVHPTMVRARLRSFLRTKDKAPDDELSMPAELAAGAKARGVIA